MPIRHLIACRFTASIALRRGNRQKAEIQFWFRLLPDPQLAAEHRAAAAIPSVTLQLAQCDDALALRPVHPDRQTEHHVEPVSIDHRLTAALAEGDHPQTFAELRASCRSRAKTLYAGVAVMTADEIAT